MEKEAGMSPSEVAGRIQHTDVRPEATRVDIERLLAESVEHGFQGAMVNPIWVRLAARALEGTPVRLCTALDFPMAGATTSSVARAAAHARAEGAQEIDVMTKVGWLRSGMQGEYRQHLRSVVEAAGGATVKAMLEAALLTPEELGSAVELCAEAGVTFLKNSSGYGGGQATPGLISELVQLSRGRLRIKASGGIRTMDQAVALLQAGAELLGSSAGVAIVSGGEGTPSY
jgi:deoxyribose-phosphate aldolase